MSKQKFNYRRDFRLATFAVFNHKGIQMCEASINQHDARDYYDVIKTAVKGCFVGKASRVIEYTLPLYIPLNFPQEELVNLWDMHVPVLEIMQKSLGLRPDNLPVLLPCKERKAMSKALSDKVGNKFRSKYGGLQDRDATYSFGEYDESGIVRYAESAMFNKGTSLLPKEKKPDRVRAGAESMPNTANDELSPLRLSQEINKLISKGKSFGEIRKELKKVRKVRNSNSQIERTIKDLV